MQNNDLPVRATTFLRDPSTGLTQNGLYDIHQETKKRSIIITSRVEQRKKKQSEEESKSAQLLSWNIYDKCLNKKYIENMRFHNELRKEFLNFISLTSQSLLSDSYTTNEVSSTSYFVLRAIYRIYKQKQTHYGNDKKINKFIQNIRDDITKYFNKISDKTWKQLYNIGCKLLYFISTENDNNNNNGQKEDFSKILKELTADDCTFDYKSIKLFSKDNEDENDSKDNNDEYKLNEYEYGYDIEFNDPLIDVNKLLVPKMTSVEKKQFSQENHRPSQSQRFKQNKSTKGNNQTNGNNNNKQKSKSKPKQPKIDKYTVEWVREKAQHIAMMKLQVFWYFYYLCIPYSSLHSMLDNLIIVW